MRFDDCRRIWMEELALAQKFCPKPPLTLRYLRTESESIFRLACRNYINDTDYPDPDVFVESYGLYREDDELLAKAKLLDDPELRDVVDDYIAALVLSEGGATAKVRKARAALERYLDEVIGGRS